MSQLSESPVILSVEPSFALPGGEIVLRGRALLASLTEPTQVLFGEAVGTVVFASPTQLTVVVPESCLGRLHHASPLRTAPPPSPSPSPACSRRIFTPSPIPPSMRPGNIYVTFSGSRGQSVPTSLFRIDDESTLHPIAAEIMNPTGLALDATGNLYISSRHDGAVYRLSTAGDLSTYAEGMGVATGLAFDELGNLYVGDRSGTIFKIAPDRQIFVFATIEPSVAAYHLAFSPNGNLYVTGPTTSSNDCVYEIDQHGVVTPFLHAISDARRASPSTSTATSTWLPPGADTVASSASPRKSKPHSSSAEPTSSALPSIPTAPSSSPPPPPPISCPGASPASSIPRNSPSHSSFFALPNSRTDVSAFMP